MTPFHRPSVSALCRRLCFCGELFRFVGENPNFMQARNVLTNGGSNSPFSGIVTGGNAGFRRFVQFGLKIQF